MFRADGLQVMKHFIQMDIFKFIPTLEKVNFIETHQNKQTNKTPEKASEKKQEKPVEQKAS